ncbi:NCS2 family permease [Paenibacillus sp. 1001270B_150601_E10]|uniref:NCS2 family permease n=1 Tax=Paenibacillus sp. 1001270B_150601_E10 TaxID=2787079 RepID=UPI003B633EEF
MHRMKHRIFGLKEHDTRVKSELLAGFITFITLVYIVVVNASILADAGIPFEAGIIATALTAFAGSLIMGLWANSPIVIAPGMGVNALFTYTIVHGMGLSWQEALAAVFVSGILFMLIAFTKLASVIQQAIPTSLKEAITAGIGLFIAFIGMQKGGLIIASKTTLVGIGHFGDIHVILTAITLIVTIILFVRKVPGNLLIGIVFGTVLSMLAGQLGDSTGASSISWADAVGAIGAMSFQGATSAVFWVATFSLVLVIVFENIGLIHGQLHMLNQPEKFKRSLRASSVSVIVSGFVGSSPAIPAVETTAGISAGGKTGLTSVTTGMLFLLSLFFIPVIKMIPDTAIAPILILVGGLMMESVTKIPFADFTEGFPAFLVIAAIPLTSSIVDGIAFGFIMYPILKAATGKWKQVGLPLYVIAALFLLNFVLHALG